MIIVQNHNPFNPSAIPHPIPSLTCHSQTLSINPILLIPNNHMKFALRWFARRSSTPFLKPPQSSFQDPSTELPDPESIESVKPSTTPSTPPIPDASSPSSPSSPSPSDPLSRSPAEPEPDPDPLVPDKIWMASRNVIITTLPTKLLQSAKSLFSSYPSTTIRTWGHQTVQSYVKISGTEKPTDIRKVQPFATSLAAIDEESKIPQNRGFYKLPNQPLAEVKIPKSQDISEEDKKFPYQKEHAVGYAYKKMPNTYAAIYRILHEIKHRMPDFNPSNCLDYGAGTGAASWAACELFDGLQVTAVEPSKEMRTVGKKLSFKQPDIKWAESLANLPSIAGKDGLFDLVICGYVLNEVENPVTRNLIVDALWQRTGGVMVFVEPGTPKGFRLIYSVRQWTLKTMTRDEANIVAPCPHDGECPLAAHPKSWCHFSQFTPKYPKSVISRAKGEFNFENEKFSYIAVVRGQSPRYMEASESLNLAQESFLWPRFVRPAIRRTKHIVFDLCRVNKLERLVLSKGKANKDVYKFLRKCAWGDLWPFKEGELINEEKRKEKFKNYRLKRKLKKREKKLSEKGESEGTDIEVEKEKIKEKRMKKDKKEKIDEDENENNGKDKQKGSKRKSGMDKIKKTVSTLNKTETETEIENSKFKGFSRVDDYSAKMKSRSKSVENVDNDDLSETKEKIQSGGRKRKGKPDLNKTK